MTRQERRAAMPECTAFIDAMREDFPGLTILRAEENGHTWGDELRILSDDMTEIPGKKGNLRFRVLLVEIC